MHGTPKEFQDRGVATVQLGLDVQSAVSSHWFKGNSIGNTNGGKNMAKTWKKQGFLEISPVFPTSPLLQGFNMVYQSKKGDVLQTSPDVIANHKSIWVKDFRLGI